VRQQAGINAAPTLYQQHGVVANFIADKPHHGIAYQCFSRWHTGVLPLPQQRVSMVWSVSPENPPNCWRCRMKRCVRKLPMHPDTPWASEADHAPCRFPAAHLELAAHHRTRLALVEMPHITYTPWPDKG